MTTMEEVMTIAPQTIGADVTIEGARRMMADFGVRHLPVRRAGRLVGVVRDTDLTRDSAHRPVVAVMDSNPLVVGALDDAAVVASAMADRRADAAIVVENERVIGIFTIPTGTHAARAPNATLRALHERR